MRSDNPTNFYGTYLYDSKEIEAVEAVIRSKSLFRYYGPCLLDKNLEFEEMLREYFGVNHAQTVSSETAALKCALKAINIGDEVIVPSYGFIATTGAVLACGGIPIFCDIDDL